MVSPPGSRFGGIIALNRTVDAATAEEIDKATRFGLGLRDEPGSRLAYYATTGFESSGGRRLAIRADDSRCR